MAFWAGWKVLGRRQNLTRLLGLRPESVVVLVYELLVAWIQASGEVQIFRRLTIETLILLNLFFLV